MKALHTPTEDARYWTAITLASIFGTNLGDFYAHESGLGLFKGLAVLAFLAAAAFVIERLEGFYHEAYYWLVIILIRTGATNIADYLAFVVRIPALSLTVGLVALLCLFGWGTQRASISQDGLPKTGAAYWLAMLTAGVFGTVAGDIISHAIGQGAASLVLSVALLAVLFLVRGRALQMVAFYWLTVAVARTTGTAIGDWLAENKILNIGLPLSTLLTGVAFVGVLVVWKSQRRETRAHADPAIGEARQSTR